VTTAAGPRRWARGRRDAKNVEVAMAMLAAFTAQDADRMVALAEPEVFVGGAPIAERTGRSDPYRGHDGLREVVRDLAEIWKDLRVTPQEYRPIGDAVLVIATLSAHSQAAMLTGSVAWVYRLRRRKVISVEVFRCEADALASLPQ
jgi:ketosteroid isomerase-like protein